MTRIVGHAERRRLGRFAAAQHRFFDLGRADPVARALDHLVVTTDETKQAVRPLDHRIARPDGDHAFARKSRRSEEHTSELQSLMRTSYAVFCLQKKNQHKYTPSTMNSNLTNNDNEYTSIEYIPY